MHSIGEKLRRRKRSIPAIAAERLWCFLVRAFVALFGGLAYRREYLTGRWFAGYRSPGWQWAFCGMMAKLFTGRGRGVPWPIGPGCDVTPFGQVEFDPDDLNNFQVSGYYQAWEGARIVVGKGSYIARGCALITANHDPFDLDAHLEARDVVLGEACWLGANVVVMPGVTLGPHTVVGANAVVTRSFEEGHCVLVGAPARIARRLE